MYRRLFKSAFIVFGFWWVVLAISAFVKAPLHMPYVIQSSTAVMVLWGIGCVAGPLVVITWLVLDRRTQHKLLGADRVRGLISSIGEVPLNAKEPTRAKNLPVFTGVPNVAASFYPLWLEHYASSHPKHVALLKAMLQIYEHNKSMPATHIRGGHAGRTLLQHSLLVAYQMQSIAMKWEYKGLRDKTGKKVLLKLRNEGYKFDPLDPMVVITGLAHDIGKIEAFIFDGGELVGSRHEHDLTGARMLARLPEMWEIPDADRQALLLAIAHYHHPMELPLAPDRHAIDDRTIALMELLIKADFTASAIERNNAVPSESDYDEEMDRRQEQQITDDVIWEALISLIEETGRINSPDRNYNVGTLCLVKGQNSARLVLHETSLRGAIAKRLGIHETKKAGDSRDELTIKLLELLDKHNVLVKTFQGVTYEAASSLWRVGFLGKKAGKGKGEIEYITGWPAAIIVLPTISKYVESLQTYHWVADIERGTMGKARAKKDGAAAAPALVADAEGEPVAAGEVGEPIQPVLSERDTAVSDAPTPGTSEPPSAEVRHEWGIEDDEPDPFKEPPAGVPKPLRRPQKNKGGTPNSTKVDLAGLEGMKAEMVSGGGSASLMPPAKSEAGRSAHPEPSVSRFIVPVAKQQDSSRQIDEISPYLLKKSIAKALRVDPVPTSPGADGSMYYIMSTMALAKHVPEVNWAAVSADIIGLSKTERGKGFIATEDSGQLYLCIDCQMMKSFMDAEDSEKSK